MIAASASGSEIKFHRSGENKYFCLIDLKAFEVSTVTSDEGVLRIELTRTAKDNLSEFFQEIGEQRKG